MIYCPLTALVKLNMLFLFKGRKRRKVRWSNTRTRRKKKGSEDDDITDEEESDEEDTEEEDDSDEDYKVERSRKRRNRNRERRSSDSSTSSDDDLPPNDDPCKHCGLPNHPELVGSDISSLFHTRWRLQKALFCLNVVKQKSNNPHIGEEGMERHVLLVKLAINRLSG